MTTQIQFVEVPNNPVKRALPLSRVLQHPVFAWAGLRATIAQHTLAEHQALMRHSRAANTIVEIGVAEGASAVGLREAMPADGTLYLIVSPRAGPLRTTAPSDSSTALSARG